MIPEISFEQFVHGFHQDINAKIQDGDTDSSKEVQFTDLMLSYLTGISEIDSFEICSHTGRGIKVNAYNFSNENESEDGIFLDLFVSSYSGDIPPQTLGKSDIQALFKRLKNFLDNALAYNYANLEESSPGFDLSDKIHHLKDDILRVRLFALIDGISNIDNVENDSLGSVILSHHVWDMPRLYRLINSGSRPEPIEINFLKKYGQSLACLPMPAENARYTTYLTILPGETLSKMYSEFGPRLLERNVRAFLQMKGKVNKGIRDTIKSEPDMFLAYNNGISATAQDILLDDIDIKNPHIISINDFQIVNGGQTTAGIHYTHVKEKRDISKVFVQVKLTVLKDQNDVNKIVPKISLYANSQNKINAADFVSNDPFHVHLEKLSRNILAPATNGSQIETYWYYERTRGQYQVDKIREKTPKKMSIFSERNPTSQRFAKTDLAKYENSWDQLPYFVSLGAEKNFYEFIQQHSGIEDFKPDEKFFRLLVAKAILFKRTDKIVQSQKFGGYKANIVTYTISLISKLTNRKIDFNRIWKNQAVSPALEKFVSMVTPLVNEIIIKPPGGKNITEWCKKKECWYMVQNVKIDIPNDLKKELLSDTTISASSIGEFQHSAKTWTIEEVPINTNPISIEDLFESEKPPENDDSPVKK